MSMPMRSYHATGPCHRTMHHNKHGPTVRLMSSRQAVAEEGGQAAGRGMGRRHTWHRLRVGQHNIAPETAQNAGREERHTTALVVVWRGARQLQANTDHKN